MFDKDIIKNIKQRPRKKHIANMSDYRKFLCELYSAYDELPKEKTDL
jgi:hypothetical protein